MSLSLFKVVAGDNRCDTMNTGYQWAVCACAVLNSFLLITSLVAYWTGAVRVLTIFAGCTSRSNNALIGWQFIVQAVVLTLLQMSTRLPIVIPTWFTLTSLPNLF